MIGIDEVGRGAWAGPLLVCAARLRNGHSRVAELTDSKTLSKAKREKLFTLITEHYDIGEGWISAEVIDQIGLSKALRCASLLSLLRLDAKENEKIIIDGTVNFCRNSKYKNVEVLTRADFSVNEVSAAAIYAKVLRDELMSIYADEFRKYGFDKNVGYGTPQHQQALRLNGVTRLHRKSYKPVAAMN